MRAKIKEGSPYPPPPPTAPTPPHPRRPASSPKSPEYCHLPHTPSLTRLERMYRGLYPVLVQWKLPLGQAAVPAEKERLLNVRRARPVSSGHGKHQKKRREFGVVVNACNPSTWEVKAGSAGQDHSQLHCVFKASLGYRKCLKNTNKPRNNQGEKGHFQGPATEPSSLLQLHLRPSKRPGNPPPPPLPSPGPRMPFRLTPPPTSERCSCWLFLARNLTSSWKPFLVPLWLPTWS